MKTPRHFLQLTDLSDDELAWIVRRGIELKDTLKRGELYTPLHYKTLAMIFEKSSTRTRVSFQTGMEQLGGSTIFLSPRDTHLDRGEPVEDTARVMSRMVDAIVIRTLAHAMVERFATYSRVPVINALTDMHHPCQLLADIQTYVEHRGPIKGRTAVWVGDGNNVCHSWIQAARAFDFQLNISTPPSYAPNAALLKAARGHARLVPDPMDAARNVDLVVTDTWASMGQEEEKAARLKAFSGFQVTTTLMQLAKKDAIFMHCLPTYRGHEVTAEVIDGPQSVVWDEAENRLHSQKALLEFLLGAAKP